MGKNTVVSHYIGIEPISIIPIKEQTEHWNYNVGASIRLAGNGTNDVSVSNGTITLTLNSDTYVDTDDVQSIYRFLQSYNISDVSVIKVGTRYKQRYGIGTLLYSQHSDVDTIPIHYIQKYMDNGIAEDTDVRRMCEEVSKVLQIPFTYGLYTVVSHD